MTRIAQQRRSEDYLTVAEVCRKVGLCRKTVYELIRSGKLAGFKLTNAYRVTPEALATYLAGQQSE